MKSIYYKTTKSQAFTLVELMVVVVIVGVMATVVTLTVNDYLVTAKQEVARSEVATIRNALELFYLDHDRYPNNDEGLAILKQSTSRHPSGYVTSDLDDPWRNAYIYIYPGIHSVYDIVSYGRDGQEGGLGPDADIMSWTSEQDQP